MALPRSAVLQHLRLGFGVFCACVALRLAVGPRVMAKPPEQALVESLAREHRVRAAAADVIVDTSALSRWPWHQTRAWVLGQPADTGDDVYSLRARLSPEGYLLSLTSVHNLTDTRGTSEHTLNAQGPWVTWASGDASHVYQVSWLQFNRSPLTSNPGLSRLATWQWRLTWLERMGHLNGASLRSFKLVPPAAAVALSFDNEGLVIRSHQAETHVPELLPPAAGGRYVAEVTQSLARPEILVNWAVNRVRQLPWFGDENMQRLKAVSYRAADWVDRKWPGLFRVDHSDYAVQTTAPQSASTANLSVPAPAFTAAPQAALRTNWPPPPLTPLLAPALASEGVWLSLDGDPFIRHDAAGHVPFLTTFLRTDEERQDSRVSLTIWDPKRVELHMMSGTEEPKSATFETGPGQIPRDPDTLNRFVAAFNGGFQSSHGEFGMMVDGTVYAPPRPYAATFAELSGNVVGFGTWPSSTDVPADMLSFRQNLTPLVAHSKYNPYHREWWGGVPAGWEDDTRTVRSGLCATEAGQLIYFYGSKVDPRNLGSAMLAASCAFGMHLDMNQGHTGFEFYQVAEASSLPPLGLRLDPVWQAEGNIDDVPGYRFRGRRLFRAMQLMNFPRYVQRETRDFFYLTLRSQLPSAKLTSAISDAGDEGTWQVPAGAGSPPVVATTALRPRPDLPESRVRLVEVDTRRMKPALPDSGPSIVSWQPPAAAVLSVWWHDGQVTMSESQPTPRAVRLFAGSASASPATRAAVGLKVQSGTLLLAEVVTGAQPGTDASLLTAALTTANANPVLYLEQSSGLNILGLDMSGHPAPAAPNALRLMPAEALAIREIFPETPVVSPSLWQPLQRRSQSEEKN